jgi:hypothetical protein
VAAIEHRHCTWAGQQQEAAKNDTQHVGITHQPEAGDTKFNLDELSIPCLRSSNTGNNLAVPRN